jgi:hypothetical protein
VPLFSRLFLTTPIAQIRCRCSSPAWYRVRGRGRDLGCVIDDVIFMARSISQPEADTRVTSRSRPAAAVLPRYRPRAALVYAADVTAADA